LNDAVGVPLIALWQLERKRWESGVRGPGLRTLNVGHLPQFLDVCGLDTIPHRRSSDH
jgi:hypothetical protein